LFLFESQSQKNGDTNRHGGINTKISKRKGGNATLSGRTRQLGGKKKWSLVEETPRRRRRGISQPWPFRQVFEPWLARRFGQAWQLGYCVPNLILASHIDNLVRTETI
jgi:hypothetical protein